MIIPSDDEDKEEDDDETDDEDGLFYYEEGEDEDGVVASVLHAAANSGSRETFEAVLAEMEAKLTPDEVLHLNPMERDFAVAQ